ncbi:hypothetical protein AXF42_Ash000864 [Apostasia shenzhenica]|uniref:Uncharacterized protein n=1 Tax=Apostasia shenzhenica TaxID=1088818 RepID=A0A2I0AT90_9ASPA|nr:hypothetical protein AXF42_Ash000864 [Apostasia shenzhenica]
MAERKKWVTLSSFSKKRADGLPVDVPPPEKRRLLEPSEGSLKPATAEPVEALQEEGVGAAVLAQTFESLQELAGVEATEVVNVSDSPVNPPLKARELKEVILVSETVAGEKLAPGKILLKDEEIERLLPRFKVPSAEGVKRTPLKICGPAPVGISIPSSEKKRKSLFPSFLPVNEEKEEKRKKEEGSKIKEVRAL